MRELSQWLSHPKMERAVTEKRCLIKELPLRVGLSLYMGFLSGGTPQPTNKVSSLIIIDRETTSLGGTPFWTKPYRNDMSRADISRAVNHHR